MREEPCRAPAARPAEARAPFAFALSVSLMLHLLLYAHGMHPGVRPDPGVSAGASRVLNVRWHTPQRSQAASEAPPGPARADAPERPPRPERVVAMRESSAGAPPPSPVPRPASRPAAKKKPPVRVRPEIPSQAPVARASADTADRSAVGEAAAPAPLPAAGGGTHAAYLERLLAHIERHKFYPLAARRRGLEGVVELSFVVDAGGRAHALEIRGGTRLLRNAARRAVQAAQPLPRPPGSGRPHRVRFRMRFALRERE